MGFSLRSGTTRNSPNGFWRNEITKLKIGGKEVSVNYEACEFLECLRIGTYTHRTSCGASGCSARTADGLSCLTRDNHGCPTNRRRLTAKEIHGDCPGRFPFRIKSDTGKVRCVACGKLVPRWVAKKLQEEK